VAVVARYLVDTSARGGTVSVRQLRLVVATEDPADYEQAVAFYRDALGMPEREAIAGPGGAHVTILDAGRATLELANPAQRRYIDRVEVGREDVAPRLRVAFEVDDARARTAELTAAGAQEIAPPTETPWRSLNSRLAAPAGLQITLFEELGPEARPAGGDADVSVRAATGDDWPAIWAFMRGIVAAGETYTWDRDTSESAARAKWMQEPPGRTVVAVDAAGTVVGTAETHPNQAGPGAHVANAGFMVDPDRGGRGIGRRLAEHVLDQARADGYRAMQFNAVVETSANAVALWRSLGFTIVGTVPEAFDHPVHGPVALHVMHRFL
jgi:L-amino acid N-acyltransferase YncA/predicted enzyme related to lactoylglutathione lyase